MAIRSKDATLIKIFRDGLDFHAMTGSFIVGKEYEELVAAYQSGDLRAKEDRQMGKLTNLSCNYRTGGKKLAKKAFEDYDIPMPVETGYFVVKTFTNRYVGVPVYWDEAIQLARTKGYTETFGGRRYKIHDWSSTRRWESESSALMVPIQGSGASMKNIAIAEIHDYSSDVHFSLDLHDASFVWVPEGDVERHKRGIDEVLENIDYEKYWGFKPDIPLLYESMVGNNFSDIK